MFLMILLLILDLNFPSVTNHRLVNVYRNGIFILLHFNLTSNSIYQEIYVPNEIGVVSIHFLLNF
jgi:hypothetical protein